MDHQREHDERRTWRVPLMPLTNPSPAA